MAETAVDAVCGMKVEKHKAPGSVEYEGETYYFCAAMCQQKLEENLEKYVEHN